MNLLPLFTCSPSDHVSLRLKLPKESPAEHEFVPFPQIDSPTDIDGLCADQEPKHEVGLRRRRRTRTKEVIEFAEEEIRVQEESPTMDVGEDDLPLVPEDFQLSLLEEDLPPDECGADVPDIEILDEESVASSTWQFTRHPPQPSPSELETPRSTSPPPSRPLSRVSLSSLPSSSSSSQSSPSSPATPAPSSPIPRQSRLPRPLHLASRQFEQPQGNRMSWSTVPPHLIDVFMGAEKEYHRLRSIVESESLFEEDLYDSDATVRPSTVGRPRSRIAGRITEHLIS